MRTIRNRLPILISVSIEGASVPKVRSIPDVAPVDQPVALHCISAKVFLKQGCILSLSLFSLYVNDLINLFDQHCDHVQMGSV